MSDQSGSWEPDPSGRHQYRYKDSTGWTEQVSDDGIISTDPYVDAGQGATAPPAADATAEGAPFAAASAPPTRGGSGNTVPLVIGGALLVALLGAAAYFLLGDDDSSSSELAAYFQEAGATDAQAECMADALDGEISVERLREFEEIDDPDADALADAEVVFDAATECGVFEDLGTIDDVDPDSPDDSGTSGLQEGDSYGDNPELDALWDACEDGDGEACDDLYFSSAVGSEYEEFGDTCGGRFEAGTVLCAQEDLD